MPFRRPGGRGAGRRPALVWPFGVRANAGHLAAFALTLRAPEDDLHRIRAFADDEIAATRQPADQCRPA